MKQKFSIVDSNKSPTLDHQMLKNYFLTKVRITMFILHFRLVIKPFSLYFSVFLVLFLTRSRWWEWKSSRTDLHLTSYIDKSFRKALQCEEEWWPSDQETPQHGAYMWLTTHTGALSKHTALFHQLCVLASCPKGPLHHGLSVAQSCSLSECSVLRQEWVPRQSLLHHRSMSRQRPNKHTSLLTSGSV